MMNKDSEKFNYNSTTKSQKYANDYDKFNKMLSGNKFKSENNFFDDKSHTDHKWLPDNKYVFSVLLILLGILTAANILTNKRRLKQLQLLWDSHLNRWQMLAIILFVIYAFMFYPPVSYMVVACKIGLYSMIIALCAYLQIPFIPFWVTHFLVYFSQNFIIV